VLKASHYYYGGIPDFIQVGDHQFVEHKIVKSWVDLMLCGWSVSLLFGGPSRSDNAWQWDRLSTTNCSKVYDRSFSQQETSSLEDVGWPWGFKLKTEHVWDTFVILSLLHDCEGRGLQLEVPHTGLQKDRFTIAMRQCNSRLVREGQPEIDHWCRKCTRIYRECNLDGTETASKDCRLVLLTISANCDMLQGIVQPLMTDGITLGRPRCAIDTCKEDLANNRDIFCATHFRNHFKCAVRSCPQPAVIGKMCADPQHQRMESLRKAHNDAPFQLSKCMQWMHVSHPNDSMLSNNATSDNHDVTDDLEGNLEWFELEGETPDDVRMFNEANPGGIGEEDVPEADQVAGMFLVVSTRFRLRRSHILVSTYI
jgi:hypothetical protein